MSQVSTFAPKITPGTGPVFTLTGNSGGAVSPDGVGNINIIDSTAQGTARIVGNNGTHTLTMSFSDANHNLALGAASLNSLTSGSGNIALGDATLQFITSGAENIAVGFGSGDAYITGTESSNIVIGNVGVNGESNVLRIGTQGSGSGQQNQAYVAGIYGNSPATPQAVIVNTLGQLGSQAITSGTVTSITAGTGITLTPNPIVSTGTVALTIPVVVSSGGTGRITLTNHGLLVGAGTSAITQLADATNGQLPIGSTGADPVLATITAGTGISVTNGAGSITIAATSTGFTWTDVTGGSATLAANNGYIADAAGLTTFTLPTNNAFGDTILIVGKGAGGWKIVYGAGQNIIFGSSASTATTGNIASTNANDCVTLICTTASASAPIFTINNAVGNISIT